MTCPSITDAFLEEQITATKALIVAYQAAVLSLGTGAVQSYQLDTGQTRQLVTKANLGSLRLSLDSLYNLLATLEARLCGAGVYARPGF
jgi:hypothetical protein